MNVDLPQVTIESAPFTAILFGTASCRVNNFSKNTVSTFQSVKNVYRLLFVKKKILRIFVITVIFQPRGSLQFFLFHFGDGEHLKN